MPRPAEERHWSTIATRLAGVIVAATVPALIFLPAAMRPTILRVMLAIGLASSILYLLTRLSRAVRTTDAGGFEHALEPRALPVRMDASLARLADELRHSRSDRRYYERILRPRLLALAKRRGAEDLPAPPPPGWLKRRGPPLRHLADLVDHLEKRL
jgi:hypothetical protein